MTEIDVWYGDSSHWPAGPIKGLLIEEVPGGKSKIKITDRKWLDGMGWDGDYDYTCEHLPSDNWVRYDDYAWCYPGECNLKTDWWNDE